MAAAAVAPAGLGTYDPVLKLYTSLFDALGREYIVLADNALDFMGHLNDEQGRFYVKDGQVVNVAADNLGEILGRVRLLTPAQAARLGGVPGVRYWVVMHEGGRQIQPDSSGGTWGDLYPEEGGTGGTGSGKPTSMDVIENDPLALMARRLQRMNRPPPRRHLLERSYFVNEPGSMNGGAMTGSGPKEDLAKLRAQVDSFHNLFIEPNNELYKLANEAGKYKKDILIPNAHAYDAVIDTLGPKENAQEVEKMIGIINGYLAILEKYASAREKVSRLLRVIPKHILDLAEQETFIKDSRRPNEPGQQVKFDEVRIFLQDLEDDKTRFTKDIKALSEVLGKLQPVIAENERKKAAEAALESVEREEMAGNDAESQAREITDKAAQYEKDFAAMAPFYGRFGPGNPPSWMLKDMPSLD